METHLQVFPDLFHILSDNDKLLYHKLREKLKKQSDFTESNDPFYQIHDYCEYREDEKWKRYFICGYCWGTDYIATKIYSLSILFSQSKSSILNLITSLHYRKAKSPNYSFLYEKMPFVQNAGQWIIWDKKEKVIQEKKESRIQRKQFFQSLFTECYGFLSDEDKELYDQLKNKLNKMSTFSIENDPLENVRKFCEYEEKDKWKRYLVCGVCWNGDYIASNKIFLSSLFPKFNTKLNFELIPKSDSNFDFLLEKIPILNDEKYHRLLNKWKLMKRAENKNEIQTHKINENKEESHDFKILDELHFTIKNDELKSISENCDSPIFSFQFT